MKFAYADPPYFGWGKMYEHLHTEARIWDNKETHIELVEKLSNDYPDGWALSCNPKDLRWILPECPETIRVCSWVKTYHQVRANVSVQFSWEPVLLNGGRKKKNRNPWIRDWTTGAVTKQTGTPGAKPDYFNQWILDLLGFEEGDIIDDLFPGSRSMENSINQGRLFR